MRHTLGRLLSISLALLSAFDARADLLSPGRPSIDSFGDPLPDGVFYRLGTVRLRHQHTQTLIFSADGSQLLSQGATSDLRVWDVATGRILQQVAVPEGRSHLIASPDDRYLACVVNSHQAVLLEKATGKELARWEHRLRWLSLAFSKDGKELVGLTLEETVVKWNVADRKEIARMRLNMTNVDVKNFNDYWHLSPDGGTVAFMPPIVKGGPAWSWHFWDTATGKQCRPPLNAPVSPSQVCWSRDGGMIAVVASDNTVKVWDTVAGKRLALEAGRPLAEGASYTPRGAAFHPKGKLLAVAIDGTVATWDVDAGKRLWGKEMSGDILAFSPDGKTLAVGGSGVISLVETATGEPVGFSRRDPGWISLAGWEHSSFLRDGQSFMVHDQVGFSQLETATGKRLRKFYADKNEGFYYGGLCGDGRLFACVGNDVHGAAQVFMFEAATGKELWRRPKQPNEIHVAADGKKVAVLSWGKDEFTLLDAATGRVIKKLPAPTYCKDDGNTFKAVSDDLRVAATMHYSGPVELWDMATANKIRSLACPPAVGRHGGLYFVPGSKLLVGTASRGKETRDWTRVWDVGTGRIIRSFAEHVLKMSTDGRWLALQCDKGLALRHLQTGRLMATIGGADPLGFSPDGSLLAVRDASRHELGLWDTLTGRLARRWVDVLSEFDGVSFAPDGRTLVLKIRTGGSMLVCDVTGRATAPGKIPAQDLTAAEADRYWLELTSDDGPRSHRARWRLVAGGEHTVKMLQRTLPRVAPPDGKTLAALIAALDSESFKEREKSSRALEQMKLDRPAFEDALKRNPSLEMKRRIALILAKQDGLPWDVELLRAMRGVLLLEQIGTPPARQLLQTLAGGAAGALLTQEAQAALQRLARTGGLR